MKKQLLLLLILGGSWVSAQTLTLEQYKNDVHGKDPGYKSAQAAREGGNLLLTESQSITGLQFTSQFGYLNDNRLTTNPAFQGDRTEAATFYFGLQQQTNYGVQWDVLQYFTHTKLYDAATYAIPVPDYYDVYPKVDLSISLWRNIFGAETKAQTYQLEQQATLRQKQAELQLLQKEIEIENSYNEVHSLQEALAAQKDGLKRAEKVLEWTQVRIERNLVDKSDIYQAQAAVTARKLEVVQTKTDLAKSIEKFNALRGIESNELKETLVTSSIDKNKLNLRKSDKKIRKDVRLQQYTNLAAEAGYKASREKYKPKLELSLSAYQEGRDVSSNTAVSNVGPNGKDYFYTALTLTIPLNQSRESDHREGYETLAKSQTLLDQSRSIDERVSWENNVDLANQLSEQIVAVTDLETQQKNKADAEREKFNRGRSTLFQVLTYEQDYLAARQQKIGFERQVRQFLTQLSLFE